MKGVLEIELPNNCLNCPLAITESDWEFKAMRCIITGEILAQEGKLSRKRDENCPLKTIT